MRLFYIYGRKQQMKGRAVRFGIVFYLASFLLAVFPLLSFNSLFSSCQRFCCHEEKICRSNLEKSTEHRSTSKCENGNCREDSSPKKGSPESKPPFRCPLELCCKSSEIPARLGLSNDCHQEGKAHSSLFVAVNTLFRIVPHDDNGIFSIPLKSLPEISGPPVYLKNRVIII